MSDAWKGELQDASRFEDLINSVDGIVWEADARSFDFTFVSRQCERITGYAPAEWLQTGFWYEHLHPQDRDGAVQYCIAHTAALQSHQFEYRFVCKDGREIWLRDLVMVIAPGGTPQLLRGLMVDITVQKRAQLAHCEAEARFRSLAEESPLGFYIIRDDRFAYVNRRLAEIFGCTQEELLALPVAEIAVEGDRERVAENIRRRLAGESAGAHYTFRARGADGATVDLEAYGSPAVLEGQPVLIGTLIDISERTLAEERLRLAAQVVESSAEGIVVTSPEPAILQVNPAFCRMTGYSAEELRGKNPSILKSHRQDVQFYVNMWSGLARQGYWQGEIWNRRSNGETFPVWLSVSAVKNDHGEVTHYIGISSDLTQHKRAEATIDRLAHFDALTGLPNRDLMLDRLAQAMVSARRHGRLVAFMLANIDRFQHINESLGHPVGDALLAAVGRRLAECVRPGDTVSRYVGDEFALVLADVAEPDDAGRVSEKILNALTTPFQIGGRELVVSVSIGVSVFPGDGYEAEQLMRNAEAAMLHAKAEGRANYQFYRSEMNAASLERLLLESSLRYALDRNEFQLYYQPQVNLASGLIEGMEALLRWRHPQMGMVSPARFIPLAEDTGQIVPIGAWVLGEACRQARIWHDAGHPELSIAVNLSPRQFKQKNLVDMVGQTLYETGLPPHKLELEITESMLMPDPDRAVGLLRELRSLGVKLSIDDFGTGYSSLAYLKRFPIDTLKIDRSFVADVAGGGSDGAIAEAVIALGRSLQLKVVAEGVETQAQLDFLRGRQCHAFQGFLYSPPVPAEMFERMLAQPPRLAHA